MLLNLLLIALWLIAIIYLHFRNNTPDEDTTPKVTILDHLLRLYIFLFGLYLLYNIFSFLIIFFSSLRIVEA